MVTEAPEAARREAMACPRPEVPPTTTAVLPRRELAALVARAAARRLRDDGDMAREKRRSGGAERGLGGAGWRIGAKEGWS
eukprot:1187184-Prorocentrum_minimum.AAC.1